MRKGSVMLPAEDQLRKSEPRQGPEDEPDSTFDCTRFVHPCQGPLLALDDSCRDRNREGYVFAERGKLRGPCHGEHALAECRPAQGAGRKCRTLNASRCGDLEVHADLGGTFELPGTLRKAALDRPLLLRKSQ